MVPSGTVTVRLPVPLPVTFHPRVFWVQKPCGDFESPRGPLIVRGPLMVHWTGALPVGTPSRSRCAVRLLPHQTPGFLDEEDASAGSVQEPPGIQLEELLERELLEREELLPDQDELLGPGHELLDRPLDELLGPPLGLGSPLELECPLGPPLEDPSPPGPPLEELSPPPPSAGRKAVSLREREQAGLELSVTVTVIWAVWPRGRVNCTSPWLPGSP